MKRIIVWIGALIASMGLIAPALWGAMATPAGAADAGLEAQFLSLLNNDRTSRGLGALSVNTTLVSVARGWSDQLLSQGSLSHNPNVAASLPQGWQRWGENVGMGPSAPSLETAFMNSPEHRANILGDFNEVGIGASVRSDGTIFVTVDFLKMPTVVATACTDTNPVNSPSAAAASGYYVLGSDGGIFSYNAPFRGSLPAAGVNDQAALMSLTPDHGGYWVLGVDGGVFSFGDAHFYGSVPGAGGHVQGVDLKSSRDGHGYWVLGVDGSVFNFGDAPYFGSLTSVGVNDRAVKLVPTPTGRGYWILGADGGIFSFGDAVFHGSLPGAGIHNSSVSMASTADGNGYWILGADGGIFSFGDAVFHGSVPGLGCQSAAGVQLVATATGAGYYVLSGDGRVFSFGDAPNYGDPASLGVHTLDLAVVA